MTWNYAALGFTKTLRWKHPYVEPNLLRQILKMDAWQKKLTPDQLRWLEKSRKDIPAKVKITPFFHKNRKKHEDKIIILTASRSSTIMDVFVGKMFGVHNGNSYCNFVVEPHMVGYKLGEFADTRQPGLGKKEEDARKRGRNQPAKKKK